jgi:NAD(P)-dependent dehydrogenase (short-subunit alcohol dehydrogenase family)
MGTILVTGATDGIGLETARQLFEMGHKVFVHGRNEAKAREAIGKIMASVSAEAHKGVSRLRTVHADLSDMKQVVALAEQMKSQTQALDVLVNNAGVYMNTKQLTGDHFEMTFAVNHLAVFLLTQHLVPLLQAAAQGRVVTVSSVAHSRAPLDFDNLQAEKKFDAYDAYATSKLANILFTRAFAALHKDSKLTANCCHPGVISTKLLRAGFNMQGDSVSKGAETSVFLATSPDVESATGKYFVNCHEAIPSRIAQDDQLAVKLWKKSEELLRPYL